ncbi:membrane protein [Moraxella macacae 0408225]|uniref:Membrane protein n=1 Tax=Moraxella macacae 0408225 TaxID=1230338 RepID=L2F6P5_9GAMM|nr:membrane protein [Moraxella macacae]ELA08466.1 membrane protein [Moraxella macacae 0408225]
MNKHIIAVVLLTLVTNSSLISTAQAEIIAPANNACQSQGIVFGFLNGVRTTSAQANKNLYYLEKLYGNTTPKGEAIKYELLYNQTNGFSDFVEVFEQRLLEQSPVLKGRFELFFEAIRGEGGFLDKIKKIAPRLAKTLDSFMEIQKKWIIEKLTKPSKNPLTLADYKEHQTRIDTWALEGYKVLLFAHSQGNLFANPAYQYARTKMDASSVQLIHIAPASLITNGKHVLADKDLVINGLRLVGQVPPITDVIPGYLRRPAGLNGKKDFLGHGLLEIYLNKNLTISAKIADYVHTSFNTLEKPKAVASQGFFTTTLTWDGAGDVDLHAFEPSMQVFYKNPQGRAGYLDVDNTHGFGPEHYFASCDKNKLQEGIYTIKLANYNQADGRTATVQIATNKQGVVLTKSVVMGKSTQDTPTHLIANIHVTKDNTGNYHAKIQ